MIWLAVDNLMHRDDYHQTTLIDQCGAYELSSNKYRELVLYKSNISG